MLALAATELVTDGEADAVAATDAVTLELAAADRDAVADSEMQMQERSLGAPHERAQQICPLHGDADGVTLPLDATDAVTLADAADEAVTDADSVGDAVTLGVCVAELVTQMHVNWSGAPQETSQQRVPRHGDDVAVTLRVTDAVAATLPDSLDDAATLAVTDGVGVTDTAGDDVADVVGLRRCARATGGRRERTQARARARERKREAPQPPACPHAQR